MNVLIGCESSGVVREAFRARGHNAYSCDLRPAADGSPFHVQGELVAYLAQCAAEEFVWDLAIFHPTCTYLCNSGVWAFSRTPPNPSPGVLYGAERERAFDVAIAFWQTLADADIPRIALENPVPHGRARARMGPYAQTLQPHQFGDDASKRTCLWLKNLPPLQSTRPVAPRIVNGRKLWANQTDGGQNKLGPSADRWSKRAETYPGIAAAMAEQWGGIDGQAAL